MVEPRQLSCTRQLPALRAFLAKLKPLKELACRTALRTRIDLLAAKPVKDAGALANILKRKSETAEKIKAEGQRPTRARPQSSGASSSASCRGSLSTCLRASAPLPPTTSRMPYGASDESFFLQEIPILLHGEGMGPSAAFTAFPFRVRPAPSTVPRAG